MSARWILLGLLVVAPARGQAPGGPGSPPEAVEIPTTAVVQPPVSVGTTPNPLGTTPGTPGTTPASISGPPALVRTAEEHRAAALKAPPPTVTVRFGANVRGAKVYWGKKLIGESPFAMTRPHGSGAIDVVFRAEGYLPLHTRAYTFEDTAVFATLTPVDRAHTLYGYKQSLEPAPEPAPAPEGAPASESAPASDAPPASAPGSVPP